MGDGPRIESRVADVAWDAIDRLGRRPLPTHPQVMANTVAAVAALVDEFDWGPVAALDWQAGLDHTRRWLAGLLADHPPGPAIDGLWFGLCNPVRDDRATADVYVDGASCAAEVADWEGYADEWAPPGPRSYCHFATLDALYRLTHPDDDRTVAGWAADYALTLVHTISAVVHVAADDPRLLCGTASSRRLRVGHDSGDLWDLGAVTRDRFALAVTLP